MTPQELEQYILIAKKHSLHQLKIQDVEFCFHYEKSEAVIPIDQLIPKPNLMDGMPGDDEMLLYSTPSFDEIMAERSEEPTP